MTEPEVKLAFSREPIIPSLEDRIEALEEWARNQDLLSGAHQAILEDMRQQLPAPVPSFTRLPKGGGSRMEGSVLNRGTE